MTTGEKIAAKWFHDINREGSYEVDLAKLIDTELEAIREAKGEGTERAWIGWSDATRAQEEKKCR